MKSTYYTLNEKKGVAISYAIPNPRHLPCDTYVLVETDTTHTLMRTEFHQGRGGQSPWSIVELTDHDIPGYVRAWLLLMGVS